MYQFTAFLIIGTHSCPNKISIPGIRKDVKDLRIRVIQQHLDIPRATLEYNVAMNDNMIREMGGFILFVLLKKISWLPFFLQFFDSQPKNAFDFSMVLYSQFEIFIKNLLKVQILLKFF